MGASGTSLERSGVCIFPLERFITWAGICEFAPKFHPSAGPWVSPTKARPPEVRAAGTTLDTV
jgi:hypothetical protein